MYMIEVGGIMKIEKNILIAFLLNLFFSVFEFIGGILTNSISIVSDSIHDFADAISIGISYILEKISKRKPNKKYTYGYLRYSVLGASITIIILLTGSILIIYNAIKRIISPVEVNYSGMFIFALVGVIVNFIAAKVTNHGHSLNQKSVNLHMLEDVFGWLIVLVGSIVMHFTNISILDPILSILVAIFILMNALKNLKSIMDIFLEKVPNNISIDKIIDEVKKIEGVIDVHHIHVWSLDGYKNYATMHVVADNNVKDLIRHSLKKININHVTIEIESSKEFCDDKKCNTNIKVEHHHHH